MTKWKWIAQDCNGNIYKYESEPRCGEFVFFCDGRDMKLIKVGKPNQNFTLINLETEDYEIVDGILTRIPRKTELDVLIEDVKKINKKAAKWMNKNRYKLDDTAMLDYCFDWDDYPKHDWCDIYEKLEEMEEQQPAKETLKYRVAEFKCEDEKYLVFAQDESYAVLIEKHHEFKGWLSDWIEVECND